MGPTGFAVGEDVAEGKIGTDVEQGMNALRGPCCWGLLPVLVVGADDAGGVIAAEVVMLCGRRGIGW